MPTDLKDIFRVRNVIEKEEELIAQIVMPEDGYSWGLSLVQLRTCPRHFHNKTTEIFVIVEGGVQMEIDGIWHSIKQGHQVTLTPGQVHKIHDAEKGTRMMVFSFPAFVEEDLIEIAE